MSEAPAASTREGGARTSRLRAVAPALGTALAFALALYALHHLMRDVHYRDVVAAVQVLGGPALLASLVATAAGYLVLMGYDWSALRYVGLEVSPGRLALASFCSYALGNTVGFAVLSGGAVRYRIYGALGIEAADIARISAFCAVAFGAGVTVVVLGSLVLHPEALVGLTPFTASTLRAAGLAGLGAVSLALALRLRSGGVVRIGRWRLVLPSARLVLVQLVFSVLDIGLAAAALYAVLPAGGISFTAFVAVFALASIAGTASHVPGGLGVFEGVMIAGLGAQLPAPAVAAGLVVYRGIYYLLPLLLAALALVLNEVVSGVRAPRLHAAAAVLAPLGNAGSRLIPVVMSTLTLVVGLALLVRGIVPLPPARLEDVRAVMGLPIFEASRLVASIAGAFLVVLARGLARRVRAAFAAALVVLAIATVQATAEGLDWELASTFALCAAALWLCRRQFYRPSRMSHQLLSPGWLMLVGAVTVAVAWVLFFAYKTVPYSHELWWQFAFDAHAPRALRAALAGGVTLALATVTFGLRPPWLRPHPPGARELSRAAAIVRAQDDPDANLALVGDKALLFSDSGESFIMYGIQGRSWVALGTPVGRRDESLELVAEFLDLVEASGGRAALYQVGVAQLSLCLDAGLTLEKLGEEAVVPLAGFDLEGPGRRDLRYAARRGGRDGLAFELRDPPHDDALLEALRAISDAWLASKHSREKSFSLGRFEPGYLQCTPLALLHESGRITAFANVLTTDTRAGATIDLMRHLPDAHGLTMEVLFIELMLELKRRGFARFTLGMAPLSGLAELPHGSAWTRLGGLVYRHSGHFYNFEGLRRFKDKFSPEWEPRYLATEGGLDPVVVAADTALLCGGGLRGVLGR